MEDYFDFLNDLLGDDNATVTGGDEAESIDPNITVGDMMTILFSEFRHRRPAGHHIDSMNSFYEVGIKQIMTKVFSIEGRQKNQRDKDVEDREIDEIWYKVTITNVDLQSPTTTNYETRKVEPLTPYMARMCDLTYCAEMYVDALIEATAYLKTGGTKTRSAEIKNRRVASIPCMVGTSLCTTAGMTKETLKELGEDPRDIGGYFIIEGHEWVIDNLENITNNAFQVHINAHLNEIARGMFLSKPGDAFENSYQVILRYLQSGAITFEITSNKFNKLEIPFYLIFKVLGMTSEREIVNHIVYGVDNRDSVTVTMLEILRKAFSVKDTKFAKIAQNALPADIASEIALKMYENANPVLVRKDDNIIKYVNLKFLSDLDKYMFPHLGSGPEVRVKKLRFLGHLINELLRVYMGVLEPTDRDSYKHKRLAPAGISVAKAFKTDYNVEFVGKTKQFMTKEFNSTPFSQVSLADSFLNAINGDGLQRLLLQSITSGNKKITVGRNEVTNRVSSQTLYHKNDVYVISTANAINTPNTSASKQNERADEMRRVQPTYIGYVDVTQSPESGVKVGTTKQLAVSASVCGASSSYAVKHALESDSLIMALHTVTPERISADKLAKVIVNGDWVGCCERAHEVAAKYRQMRRNGDGIHYQTTIVWDPLVRKLNFWTDTGRLMRPLVIVYNNINEYIESQRTGDKSVQFNQWVKLTKSHIEGLRAGSLTMTDLRNERVIEYIAPEEMENAYLAMNIDTLRKYANDVTHSFTHCDIDQAIFGVVTLTSPMANHAQCMRTTYYTSQRKQASSWFALNYPYRTDKNTTLQWYCEVPLISTFSDTICYPSGQNLIVALAMHTGYNCEDSITANAGSIDCGLMNASFYTYEKTRLEKGEQYGNPDITRTMDKKRDATYEFTDGKFILEGTLARKGYVLVVKMSEIPDPKDKFLYLDRSVIYKKDEPAYVAKVITARDDADTEVAKVVLRSNRPMCIGDKMSSRHGNKGICAILEPRCDMPYCEDGLVPDIIVNAHSIPTRMAVNQITECLLGILAVRIGAHIDGTAFREQDFDSVVEDLKKYGIKYGGHRRMYCGRTGEWIDTQIFIGPTTYQRLQKFVVDEHYAIRTGPTSATTRQPLDGKPNEGGLRVGEMEKDVLGARGASRALGEKFYTNSDGFTISICRRCGGRAITNEENGLYKCKRCGDYADIANVQSSWVANVFFDQLAAMNIGTEFVMSPHVYAEYEQ